MEQYLSNDGTVAKYVHDDGSETSIKTWPLGMESCGGSGRDKFNVFISVSVGCQIKCGFCYLTSKKFKYEYLSYSEIVNNVSDAIGEELQRRPELKKVPMNLSFMGMGDAWFRLEFLADIVGDIILNFPNIEKIEGVDIATTLPFINYDDKKYLYDIEEVLQDSGKLTDKPSDRTSVRIFYSLHSLDNITRKILIPRTLDLDVSLPYLERLSKEFNIIYHYIFLNRCNDFHEDIYKLIEYFKFKRQLRILRFNKCINSKFNESNYFDDHLKTLKENIYSIKYQLSPGSEVSAACGMFLMEGKNEVEI